MKISEETIAGYRRLTTNADRQGAACLDAATLSALAAGELDAASRDRALDHIVGCSDCATELRLAKEIQTWSEATPEQVETSRVASFRPVWATLAAALLAIVIGSWWWTGVPSSNPERPQVRQGGAGSETAQPSDGSELQTMPDSIGWQGVAGAESYRVRVLDAAGQEIWQSSWIEATEVEPSWTEAPAGAYLWTVEVRGPVSRKRLGPFSFSTAKALELNGHPEAREPDDSADPSSEPGAQ